MEVLQEHRRRFTDSLGQEVELILRDPGVGKWSEMQIEFRKDFNRAVVGLSFEEASRIVDFFVSALLRPGSLSNVYIHDQETGTVLTFRSGEGSLQREGFSLELVGRESFQVSIGRDDAVSLQNVLQTFVEAMPHQS